MRPASLGVSPSLVTAMPLSNLERYRAYLLILARRSVPAAEEARIDPSGVVQQTLIEADQAAGELANLDLGRLLAWLRTALARNLTDEYRRAFADRRDLRREERIAVGVEQSASGLVAWLAADQSSPSQRADFNEQVLRLAAALAALPDAQREAIERHYLQGEPIAVIAAGLGRTPAAVAGLLKRGLKTLREMFCDQEE